ncbi:HpsJ family protein [Aphanizomenon sp. CS-733/32]|uniref:hormogonium polysaccharide biosynthesis protein HpsJ n=1 Tax=Aphanizomenon sp. CS-733/32 TaxID=3021715 RepID=UPI00232D02D8|nr:HpsJ family protein [Aphanizomenon sp. CS-733/32]MDB9309845.1 HpsJ family protein [Aphanizomenon sp. CS-733/32]
MATSISSRTSFLLQLIGIICILFFSLDLLFLLFPLQITDKLWQINLCRSLVDQGIVPLLGLGAIITAYWVDRASESSRSSSSGLKLPIFILSSLLGLIFLLIFPLHLSNVNQLKAEGLTRIEKEAEQSENQVKSQLAQLQNQLGNDQVKASVEKQRAALKEQLRTQLNELVKDEQKYNQALSNNQLPEAQKDLLKQYKTNLNSLDNFIAQQTDPEQLAKQRISQIQTQAQQQLQKTQEDAWKELRTGINSLLLSIGYIVIGWRGLRGMGVSKSGSSSLSTRK